MCALRLAQLSAELLATLGRFKVSDDPSAPAVVEADTAVDASTLEQQLARDVRVKDRDQLQAMSDKRLQRILSVCNLRMPPNATRSDIIDAIMRVPFKEPTEPYVRAEHRAAAQA